MKKQVINKIITIALFAISLLGLVVFSFFIFIWLDIEIFGLQDPEFTSENSALFYDRLIKMAIVIGGMALFLGILFTLYFISYRFHKRVVLIVLFSAIEACLASSIIVTVVFEFNFGLITNYAFTVPTFYLTHLPLMMVFGTSVYIYLSSSIKQIKKA